MGRRLERDVVRACIGHFGEPRAFPKKCDTGFVTRAYESPERRTNALKGWNNLIPPFQGSRCTGPNRLPRRCPGLSCCALSGRNGRCARRSRNSDRQCRSSPHTLSRSPVLGVRDRIGGPQALDSGKGRQQGRKAQSEPRAPASGLSGAALASVIPRACAWGSESIPPQVSRTRSGGLADAC